MKRQTIVLACELFSRFSSSYFSRRMGHLRKTDVELLRRLGLCSRKAFLPVSTLTLMTDAVDIAYRIHNNRSNSHTYRPESKLAYVLDSRHFESAELAPNYEPLCDIHSVSPGIILSFAAGMAPIVWGRVRLENDMVKHCIMSREKIREREIYCRCQGKPEQVRNIEKAHPNNTYVDFVVDAIDEPWQSERH